MSYQQPLRKFVQLPAWHGGPASLPPFRWWEAPSCSYSNREYGPTDLIVIHATAGGSTSGAMSVTQECKASWHWIIPDEDEAAHGQYAFRCVRDHRKAWHVLRRILFPADGQNDTNSRSYGIEVVNRQIGEADQFSDWQVEITAQIVNYCRAKHPTTRFYLATHSYLDPGRKSDPGAHFPWQTFMQYIREGEAAMSVDVDEYAKAAVEKVRALGLMAGVASDRFGGREPMLRQDVAIVIARLVAKIESGEIVPGGSA